MSVFVDKAFISLLYFFIFKQIYELAFAVRVDNYRE